MLQQFGPDIWIVDGSTVTAGAGFHYPTRMVVIRLKHGGLVVWSPVAPSDDLHAGLRALGVVQFIVAPNSLHHTFLGDWQRSYPDAAVYAPPGLSKIRRDVRLDGDLADGPIPAWAGAIETVVVRGNRITTEAVFFHHQSQTAIFADLLQQFRPGWFTGWRAVVARLDLMVADEPTVPRKFRVAFTDRRAAREDIRRILEWPVEKVIVAHGEPVTRDGHRLLQRAFRWLRAE